MSKTFETNAEKALTMASGIKKHLSEVAHLGIPDDVYRLRKHPRLYPKLFIS